MFKASQMCCSVVPHTRIKHAACPSLWCSLLCLKADTPHCFLRTERDKGGCSGKINKNLRRHKRCLFRKHQDRISRFGPRQFIFVPLPFCLVQILLCSLNFGVSALALQTCGVGSQAEGSPKAPQPEEKQEEDVEIIGNPWVPESQQRACQRP